MVSTLAETLVLQLHVAAGFAALFAGTGALATEKGGRRHRLLGRGYAGSMAVVSGSALLLLPFDPAAFRQFLALVAVFSFYFVLSGYRSLPGRRSAVGPAPVDWTAARLLLVASFGLVGFAFVGLLAGTSYGPVTLAFGGLGAVFGAGDSWSFRAAGSRGSDEPGETGGLPFADHVSRMAASYVAAVSAFSAVNFGFLPTTIRWLWPTILGTPLIFLLVRRYRRSFPAGTA
jgi:uncharacterized membrane protein